MKKIDWIRVKIWLPFVIFSTAVFIMTYMVAAHNRAWQIENGIPPCNIEMAYPLQVIAYWVVMLVPAPAGAIGFFWVILDPMWDDRMHRYMEEKDEEDEDLVL